MNPTDSQEGHIDPALPSADQSHLVVSPIIEPSTPTPAHKNYLPLVIIIVAVVVLEGYISYRIYTSRASATLAYKSILAGKFPDAVKYSLATVMGNTVIEPTPILSIIPTSTSLPTPAQSIAPSPSIKQVNTPTPKLTPTLASTPTQYQYKVTFFDVDAAKDPTSIQSTTLIDGRAETVQHALSALKLKASIIETYAVVFTSIPTGTATNSETIYWNNTWVPIPLIGDIENGKINSHHKYVLIRGSLRGGDLEEIVTHEVGHLVADSLTPDQFKAYMQVRKIPTNLIDSWYDFYKRNREGEPALEYGNWPARPDEDFCEVLKSLYGSHASGGNWQIKTKYGAVSAETKVWMDTNIKPLIQQS